MRSTKVCCHLCGQAFSRRYQLQAHLDAHNGIKRFGCDSCKIRFTRKHDLKVHMEAKHPKGTAVQISCRQSNSDGTVEGCRRLFSRRSLLLRHLRSAGGRSCRSDNATGSSLALEFAPLSARQSSRPLGEVTRAPDRRLMACLVDELWTNTRLDNNATTDWGIVLWKVVLVVDASIAPSRFIHGMPRDQNRLSKSVALETYQELLKACRQLISSSGTTIALKDFRPDASVYALLYIAVAMLATLAAVIDDRQGLTRHCEFSSHRLFQNIHNMPVLVWPSSVYMSSKDLKTMVDTKLQRCSAPPKPSWKRRYEDLDTQEPTVYADRWLAPMVKLCPTCRLRIPCSHGPRAFALFPRRLPEHGMGRKPRMRRAEK